MELVRLEDHLKLNIPEIDAQHETLISLINRLHDAMLQEAGKAALDGLLSELLGYTRSHCSYEEQLMLQYAYPGYETHKSEHNGLIQRLVDLIEQYQNGELLFSFAVMLELKGWATVHIENSDKLLGAFLHDRQGVDAAPDQSERDVP